MRSRATSWAHVLEGITGPGLVAFVDAGAEAVDAAVQRGEHTLDAVGGGAHEQAEGGEPILQLAQFRNVRGHFDAFGDVARSVAQRRGPDEHVDRTAFVVDDHFFRMAGLAVLKGALHRALVAGRGRTGEQLVTALAALHTERVAEGAVGFKHLQITAHHGDVAGALFKQLAEAVRG